MSKQQSLPLEMKPSAIIVQQGKVLDFIDGLTQRDETPEEYVWQEIAKSLAREYRYPKSDIAVEFKLKLGSRNPRVDLVIFPAACNRTPKSGIIGTARFLAWTLQVAAK